MKTATTLIMFLIAIGNLKAQRNCGDVENQLQIEAHYPQAIINRQAIEQFTADYINSPTSKQTRAIVTIPVVFHVIYNPSVSLYSFPMNVSDAYIASQIDRLNLDFSKTNPDWTNTPAVFQAAVGNPNIQFVLAKRDPNGQPTSGIIRKITSKVSFSNIGDSVKYSVSGGDDAWPPSLYLNIWVCNLQNGNGLVGYAQFPGGPSATDGVVLRYDMVGDKGPAYSYMSFSKGRTATHEVGHWLNVYHIWGDDGNLCTGSDLVNDTENQAGYNIGSPTFPHYSCGNLNGDMFMNYMDYTNDAVTVMFTNGQASRMQAMFAPNGARASLLTSMGGVATSVASSCGVPTTLTNTAITQTSATIAWDSVPNATSYCLQYKAQGATTFTTVNYYTNTSFNLTGLVPGTYYNWQVNATCANGTSSYAASTFRATPIPGCIDNYEPNNTYSQSKSVPANTVINATINVGTDKDFFYCKSNINARNVKITMENMTKNYEISVYKDGVWINYGTYTSNTTKEVVYNTNTYNNFYVVKVTPFYVSSDFDNDNCYNLKYEFSATPFVPYDMPVKLDPNFTSTNEQNINFDINVYPSPSNGNFKIDILNLNNNKRVNVLMLDMLGKTVYANEVELGDGLNTKEITTNLPSGVYQVIVKNEENIATKKVVITQ